MLHCYLKEAVVDSLSHQQSLQLMLRSKHSAHLNLLGVVLPLTHQEDSKAGRQDGCHHGHAQHQEQVPCRSTAADPWSAKLQSSGLVDIAAQPQCCCEWINAGATEETECSFHGPI